MPATEAFMKWPEITERRIKAELLALRRKRPLVRSFFRAPFADSISEY